MIKLIDVWPKLKEKGLGECVLDPKTLNAEDLAITFGRLFERETGREIKSEAGMTSFLYVVEGAVRFRSGADAWTIVEGEGFVISPGDTLEAINPRSRPSFYMVIKSRIRDAEE